MDVVITYVDATDQFINVYNENTKDLEKPVWVKGNRFRSYGVLDLQIKLIRKYMPYVNNIFVVISSEDQIPDNFDMSLCTFVYHKQIIPEEYLPLFNSCAIEMFIHRIPNLDEQFIYFNDDMFVINFIPPQVWFKDGKPCLDFNVINIFDYTWNILCKHHAYNSTFINAKYFNKEEEYNEKLIEYAHCGRPLLKSSCDKVYEIFYNDIINSLSKLRTKDNFNTNLFNDYEVISGNYIETKYNYKYFNNDNIDNILSCINKKENQLICVNDTVYAFFELFTKHFKLGLEANLNNTEYTREKLRDDKIIVTLMADNNTIHNCYDLIYTIIHCQTYVPDKIVLNLSHKNIDQIPKELNDLINNNPDICEIYWCPEYTEFNRMMYTLERYPDDIIIPININYTYTSDFIETLYIDYISNGKRNPLSYEKNNVNKDFIWHGIFNITESKFYGKYLKELFNDFNYERSFSYENLVYTLAAKLNGYYYKNGSRHYNSLIIKDIKSEFLYDTVNKETEERAMKYIEDKYNDK